MFDREMDSDNKGSSKKIKFRSISTTTEPLLGYANKFEDINSRQRSQSEQKYKTKEEPTPSLLKFLGVELTRGYILEHDEEQYSARREKVYSFARIPTETEKFMAYGFFQCADSYLFVYTFLPVRFLLAIWALITRPIRNCFGFGKPAKSLLKPAEICDLLKVAIIFLSTAMMFVIDTSMMYHLIKSQSVIKLYIFYNMLEVGDRLFSAFGQDLIDALFWTATEPRGRKRDHVGILPHFSFVVAYVFSHSVLVLCQATTLNVAINSSSKALLVLCQATTLNVAINSSSKALLTIMISNNFVELKGSVFKKFDKNNLFQVACSDVRERFHLFVLLFIVVLQTMKEYSWKEETLWVLVPDCIIVLFAEMLVDWVKHAFITRFNELPFIIYRDYTLSLAYDMAQTRQKNAFTDHSDLVARRMGFIPLPLTVVMLRVLGHTVKIEGAAAISLTVLAFLCVTSFKILNSVTLLGIACNLINHHQQDNKPPTDGVSSPVKSIKDSATSPTRPHTPVPLATAGTPVSLRRSLTVADPGSPSLTSHPPPTLNSTPLFTNSAVSITDVCLNEEMLRVGESGLESIGEECLTRSVPNIQQATEQPPDPETRDSSPSPTPVKRAESEPSLPHAVEAEGESQD